MKSRRLSSFAAALMAGVLGTSAALAVDTPPSSDLPDLSAIRAKIYSGEYQAAVHALLPLAAEVKHADLYNLLGFSFRSLGKYDEAGRWYREALHYDPAHRPAIEYQGELFIAIGNLDAARANADVLRLLCPSGCSELETLEKSLAQASSGSAGQTTSSVPKTQKVSQP